MTAVVQRKGAILLHAALCERGDGRGVLIAGRSGVGKSTSSRRMTPPWRALSDDAALVVRHPSGRYWAHPWPTWSRFRNGDEDLRWDVQHAVPLDGILLLEQAPVTRVEPVQAPHAIGELVRCAEDIAWGVLGEPEKLRELRLERFDNICNLVASVPCAALHAAKEGPLCDYLDTFLQQSAPTSAAASS